MRDDLVWPSRLGVRLARPDSPTGKVTSVHLLLPDCLLAPAASAASRYLWHLAVCWLYRNCSQKPTTRLTQPPNGQQAKEVVYWIFPFYFLFDSFFCWLVDESRTSLSTTRPAVLSRSNPKILRPTFIGQVIGWLSRLSITLAVCCNKRAELGLKGRIKLDLSNGENPGRNVSQSERGNFTRRPLILFPIFFIIQVSV